MIKKYKKKDGTTAYMFVAYLGTDPITGKQKRTTRRGFKTERESTYQRVLTLFDTAILEHFKDIPVKKNHCAVLSKSYQ